MLLSRDGSLSLAERQTVTSELVTQSQTSDHSSRIDPGRQQKYQWRAFIRIF